MTEGKCSLRRLWVDVCSRGMSLSFNVEHRESYTVFTDEAEAIAWLLE